VKKLEIRGVMFDPARQIEKRAVYRDLIPMLAEWGYNTLFWHFTDDEGCRMTFPRRPELASPHAYSQQETRSLIRHAGKHGLSVIPEVECFGHTNFITQHKKYAHLQDGVDGKTFSALCPFHEDSKALLNDLLQDTVETFPSPYIHVGLDEVGFGKNPTSRHLLKKKAKWELFAEHICWIHETLRKKGKTMLMWGDHLLGITEEQEHWADQLDTDGMSREIIHRIPKDIIICDWHYNANPNPETLDFFLDQGFKVIATPATMASGSLVHPRQTNLDNVRNFTKEAKARSDRGVIGVMNAVWCPFRNFPGVTLHAMALAARQQATSRISRKPFDDQFLRVTFGLKHSTKVGEVIETLYQISPPADQQGWMNPGSAKAYEGFDAQKAAILAQNEEEAAKAVDILKSELEEVGINRKYYEDIVFAAIYFAETLGRPMRMLQIVQGMDAGRKSRRAGDQHKAIKHYREVLQQLNRERIVSGKLYRLGKKRWSHSRYPRSGQYPYGHLMDLLEGAEIYLNRLTIQMGKLIKNGKGRVDLPRL
jgi:hypothetical protein